MDINWEDDPQIPATDKVQYEFRMVELDAEGNATREVVKTFNANAGITHPEVTAEFEAFLKGCGYIWGVNDGIRFVRAKNRSVFDE